MSKRNSKTAAQGTSGIAQIGDVAWKFEMFSKRVVLTARGWEREEHAAMPEMKVN